VLVRKNQTLGERRVGVQPKRYKRRGVRVGEIVFTHGLKRMGGDLGRARNDSVYQLQAENIGVGFLQPAVAVDDRRTKKRHSIDQQKQDGQRGQVMRAIDFPSEHPGTQQAIEQQVGEKKSQQQQWGKEQDAVADVIQDVVPGLVAKDEKSLLWGHLLQQRIVNDDAFRPAETGNIG